MGGGYDVINQLIKTIVTSNKMIRAVVIMKAKEKPLVCAYYFPNWHQDPRNDYWHGKGWTEWNVVKCAMPRFPGHKQPKVPLWGYEDESDPIVMEKKIAAALSHGVDGFVFDWYWFEDGAYRIKCLDEGFLGASNANEMQFSIMWANHDPILTHPGSRMYRCPPLLSGKISPRAFVEATDHCIKNYFTKPNYIRIDRGLYFSIFKLSYMVEGLGGEEAACEIFDDFRKRVRKAGLGELNINAITTGIEVEDADKEEQLLEKLGINSLASYGWLNTVETFPCSDYWSVAEENIRLNETLTSKYKLPFYPTVCMGWDVSPRAVQSEVYDNIGYPFMPIFSDNTPERFEKALKITKDFVQSGKATGNMILLNAWNEWTEGSYLEPDTDYGYEYLEAIRRTFKTE